MRSVADKVMRRVQRKGRGYSFTAKDFLDLASRGSVDVALSTLTKSGRIRRVSRGVYDYPPMSEILGGPLAPEYDQVARAIARATGSRIQPSGPVAANLLGLSKQVPAKIEYLTNGPSRTVRIGSLTIKFKCTRPKNLPTDRKISLVIQALRFLGKEAMGDEVIRKLRQALSFSERKRLLNEAKYNASWVADIARRIARESPDG